MADLQFEGDPQMHEDMRGAALGLATAKQYGLETEVVVWALYAMQRDPKLTVSQAISEGLSEWVK